MMVLSIPVKFKYKVKIGVDQYNAAQEWTFQHIPECYYESTMDKNGKVFVIYSFKSDEDAIFFKLRFA